jgi:threonine synthase
MRYLSTRGSDTDQSFSDILLSGLAKDGGLYVPESWPQMASTFWAQAAGRPFADVAADILLKFTGGQPGKEALLKNTRAAYGAFRHPATCPLIQIADNTFILELFHGPTLAFKDVAMQTLARLMDDELRARGQRATIVGATSGDTGGAAIEALRGLSSIDVFILFPHGRVSDVQRRQMTTVADKNIHALAVEGTFDDCQALVKAMFNDTAFRKEQQLSGVNSINWARIAAQIPYYVTAAASLGAPHRPIRFAVPTGNFGDVFAGYVAQNMGLPIEKLIVATNSNDILARTLETGRYEVRGVVPTASPSMDIEVSSNFERLMFDTMDRDASAVSAAMQSLKSEGQFTLPAKALETIRSNFAAERASEPETMATIKRVWEEAGYLLDPHTAVGLAAAQKIEQKDKTVPLVVLATAHPAKFPAAVEKASGKFPDLPTHLADLHQREEHFTRLENDLPTIQNFIRAQTGQG